MNTKSNNLRYWICQLAGWGTWVMVNLFIAYQFASDVYLTPLMKRNLFLLALFIDFFWGIVATHLLRTVLKKINWIRFSAEKVFFMFILGVIIAGLLSFYGSKYTSEFSGYSYDKYEKNERRDKAEGMEKQFSLSGTNYYNYEKNGAVDSTAYSSLLKIKKATGWYRDKKGNWQFEEQRKGRDWWGIIFSFILTSMWLLIYLVWHYIVKNNRDRLDKLRLEGLVKTLELKTIKSHINPHFIFNALNSIRALVDENPERARTAITELSNILRSSLKAETLETVPLQQEMDIVQDYLALEQMRFEERLKIEMNIDPDTLTQPVPPMMLQTLVENAIKHGISRNMDGGLIKIYSHFKDGHHELIVQNTGNLQPANSDKIKGFGIQGTQDRLNLLYQGKAYFQIKDIAGDMVESKITMPAAPILSLT
jgi:two-component system, LytTR family, sensor kinase